MQELYKKNSQKRKNGTGTELRKKRKNGTGTKLRKNAKTEPTLNLQRKE